MTATASTELRRCTGRRLRSLAVILQVAAFVAALVLASAAPAGAADVEVDAPAESAVGETVVVVVTVVDAGAPAPNVEVTLSRAASFAGKSGYVELASGSTGTDGTATLRFVQYAAASDTPAQYRIDFGGTVDPGATSFEMTVLPGLRQTAMPTGVDVGYFNVGLPLVLVTLAWAFVFVAALQLRGIRRDAIDATFGQRAMPEVVLGIVGLTALGMFYVILTPPELHANHSHSAGFDRVPSAVLGEDQPYQGLGSQPAGWSADLDGRMLSVQTGCASCHGIDGRGAVVGGELSGRVLDDFEDFVDAVRRGPKGMPMYSDVDLPDEAVQRIIDYFISVDDG